MTWKIYIRNRKTTGVQSPEFTYNLHMENKGQVLTREQRLESVWNYDKEIESRTLDVHIGLLRQKLNNQKLIETVRGVGYRIS